MSFSFIHCGDIHLGRSFSGFGSYCENSKLNDLYKKALKKTFDNLINFALEKEVDFVLIAGDTFDCEEQNLEAKMILKSGLKRLENANIKVYLICGNHDPLESYNKKAFNFDNDSIIKIVGLNSNWSEKFIIYDKKSDPIAVLQAVSFKNSCFEGNILENLTYPTPDEKKLFNIALLHCDLDGTKDSPYAPVSKTNLEEFNFDYCALGHIHAPNLNEASSICYCGTLQGRNTKETGVHGVRYIEVEDGKIIQKTFKPLDSIRYEDIEIDLSEASEALEAINIITNQILDLTSRKDDTLCELFLIRVNLSGSIEFFGEINDDFFEKTAENVLEASFSRVSISEFYNNTIPAINEKLLKDDDNIAGLLYRTAIDEDALENAFEEVKKRFDKLIKNCDFSSDELEEFKSEVKKTAKQACENLSSQIYNNYETCEE